MQNLTMVVKRNSGVMSYNKFGYSDDILKLIKNRNHQSSKDEEIEQEIEPKPEEKINPLAVIGLNGIKIHENGQLSKTKYFEMLKLNEEDYSDIKFTPEEARKVALSMRSMSTGLQASIPLTCKGATCAFASTCPYQQADKAPVGRPCIIEKQLITYWTEQYVNEFDVNFQSPTEVRMVSELAEFDIYEMRITKYLAENHPTLLQEVKTVSADGCISISMEISRAFDLKERIKRNRMKVLEALVATRKDKIKIMSEVAKGNSVAEKIGDLKKKIENLQAEVGKMDYIDAEVVNSMTS